MATEEASPSASGASGSATQAGTITVEGNEFKFTPATLTVKKGQQVKVTFKNTGQYPHNFIVDELNVKSNTIQPGQSDTVTFTPSKTGAFTYYCGVDAHEQKGMKGTITVQ
jgi:plastocyanin